MGISYTEFQIMTVEEFDAIYSAWAKHQDALQREEWERMRLHACIDIQPHVKNTLTPRQLLPLRWDKAEDKPKKKEKKLTKKQRMELEQSLISKSKFVNNNNG